MALAESKIHLMNINEDPILTGYVRHILQSGENVIGNKIDEGRGFWIGGLGIADQHCVLSLSG